MTKQEAISEMERLIALFPDNLPEALQIGEKAVGNFAVRHVSNVLISGLGGSGIGGKIMSQLVWDVCPVPITLVHDYRIPAFVGSETLFIASSYSGNTEETLSTLEQAMKAGASVVCITSGGKLEEIARKNNLNLILIPAGQPPRTSFGYNAMQLLFAFHAYGLIGDNFKKDLADAAAFLKRETESIRTLAREVAEAIHGTAPIIYAETYLEGVAVRLRQQLNENAKILTWHHVLPEMNHNELVGWAGAAKNHTVLLIRSPEDHPGTVRRMELSKEIISRHAERIIELHARGDTRIARLYYLIHLADWISYYLAVRRDVDPIEIEVIDYFKDALAK